MINLKSKPFLLGDEDISWVKETLKNMNLKEKIGQLFCPVGSTDNEAELKAFLKEFNPGGMMYRPAKGEDIRRTHEILQSNSKIPLLLGANLESGGNGIATDGTYYGKQMQVAATNDNKMAYKLGVVCGKEANSVGCNWAFAPIVDIDMNFRNPITNVRTFGSNENRVLDMAKEYIKGINENGVIAAIKHFPGDGVDERDQHLLSSVNSLNTEEWDKTYGKIYSQMIEEGVQSVMVGHILLPNYSKKLNPNLKDEEIMPATLAPELLNGLLREKLGFNGLIVTDATAMIGFNVAERREIAVPKAIAAGCDVFLFNKNIKEDFEFMMAGIEKGILTEERVDEAVTRILATKASFGLHKNKLVPDETELKVLKCKEHEEWARECADKSVTLVKDTQGLLPITSDKYKRIRLYILGEDNDGGFKDGDSATSKVKEKLEKQGFEVNVFDNKKLDFREVFDGGINDLKDKYDLVIYVANVETASNQTTVRLNWIHLMAANAPWFVKDIPTMFISLANPYHLLDVPMIKTFINAYSASEYVVDAVVEKITGKSEFKGVNPVDPFCNVWGARF
ncbi:MAG: glycoside hydrolase family 3 protein [Clostridium sp.]|uniref:glycoside hydrolase family 3 protein n=1 Tax=Clostridium sp. TaxID=1506 RepID=UPI0025BCE1FE|nr:glycoside hydrolase family 3 N-terminal domain-containing protein [Clostridium sp.]MBS4956951.1 glycoside hydrolase family 3 protein [Clostridium sp.]